MIKAGFYIGRRDWWVMAYLGVDGVSDLNEVYEALLACGKPDYEAQEICMVLSRKNTGYTFSDLESHYSIIITSAATSAEEMFDSIVHELKHLTEHISSVYGLNPKEELSAYLQGEVGRKLFPAASFVLCPL